MKVDQKSSDKALTLFEVMVILAVLAIVITLMLPQLLHRPRVISSRIRCINNLHQVGLSFRQWAIDNDDKFPMEVSVTNGGTLEYNSSGGVYWHFAVMSNDLNTPKILNCPDDTRQLATSFSSNFAESNISYFVGLDAKQTWPNMFLAGDRNLTNGMKLTNGIMELRSNTVASWTDSIHKLQGNVGLADGSVQGASTMRVRQLLVEAGDATNRLALPLD